GKGRPTPSPTCRACLRDGSQRKVRESVLAKMPMLSRMRNLSDVGVPRLIGFVRRSSGSFAGPGERLAVGPGRRRPATGNRARLGRKLLDIGVASPNIGSLLQRCLHLARLFGAVGQSRATLDD